MATGKVCSAACSSGHRRDLLVGLQAMQSSACLDSPFPSSLTVLMCDPETNCALVAAAVLQPGLAGWDGCWKAASHLQGCLVKAFRKHFSIGKSCLIISPPPPVTSIFA